MEKLRELINLISLNKIKAIEIIDHNLDSDTKLMQFYHGIRMNKLHTDDDAVKFLYPDTIDRNAYYKLKHTLRERLFNTLFFIDVKSQKYSDIHKAKLNIQKLTRLVNILITKGVKKSAIDIARKALKVTVAYEFTEERLSILRILRINASTMLGDQKLFQTYTQQLNECVQLIAAEIKAEEYFLKILSLYVNSKSTKPYVYDLARKFLRELEPSIPAIPTANWVYHYGMIDIAKSMSINDYEGALATCEEALQQISSRSFVHTKSMINISSQAIACCIQLKFFERGEENILRGLNIMQKGIFNWFKYKELHVTLCFHTRRYENAWLIFSEAMNHRNFKKLRSNVQEVWMIYNAWFHFFYNAGRISAAHKETLEKTFRVARYANEVPTFFKDKRGLNVPILISQIMLLLQQKRYDTVLDRMDAIAKYRDRYVDKTHNFRSNTFIRMLLTIPKAFFKRKQVIEKTQKDLEQLQEVPIDLANQSADIEIIPYEDAWEILLEQLG